MKEDIKHILKFINRPDLCKLYSRNSTVQIAENFAYYCMVELKKVTGIEFAQFTLNNNEFIDLYTLESELDRVHEIISKRLDRSKDSKQFFEKEALPIFKQYTALTKRMQAKYTRAKVGDSELVSDYTAFAKMNARFIAWNFFIYLSDDVIDKSLKRSLEQYLRDAGIGKQMPELLLLISTPLHKPAVVKEHQSLLALIAKAYPPARHQKALAAHIKKWRWFPCYNPCNDPYTKEHYQEEMKGYTALAARQELRKIERQQRQHKQGFQKFLRSVKDRELRKLILITNTISFYREYRNDIRRAGLYNIRPLYERIGRKLGLNVQEVCYLTHVEIRASLAANKPVINKERIAKRFGSYALFTTINKNMFIDDAASLAAIVRVIKGKETTATSVSGKTAFQGIARGMVRVVSNISALSQFKSGEIMVASMTGPEYVPAMKKTAAIITDEGGITCHAAVIAREMGIPCIVGTKVATKVFKDGDLVEADAEKGIVRKIFS